MKLVVVLCHPSLMASIIAVFFLQFYCLYPLYLEELNLNKVNVYSHINLGSSLTPTTPFTSWSSILANLHLDSKRKAMVLWLESGWWWV